MLALVLSEAGFHPSFIIGGDVNEIGTGAVWDGDGGGDLFVVEADESDGTFLELPRARRGRDQRRARPPRALRRLRPPSRRVQTVPRRDPRPERRVRRRRRWRPRWPRPSTRSPTAPPTRPTTAWSTWSAGASGSTFSLHHAASRPRGASTCPSPVRTTPATRPRRWPPPSSWVRRSSRRGRRSAGFAGVARRFEHRGEVAGITFIDDYAHLPTEVAAALSAARSGDWRRVVCVFQPHRYSRTAALWAEFADAFGDADLLAVTDIYPAGEAPAARRLGQARRPGGARRPPVATAGLPAPPPRRRHLPRTRAAARRPLPHPGRRRPDVAARGGAGAAPPFGGAGPAQFLGGAGAAPTLGGAGPAPTLVSGTRSRRPPPSSGPGPRPTSRWRGSTTYRVGGLARLAVTVDDDEALEATGRGGGRQRDRRAGRRAGIEPARGRRRLRRAGRRAGRGLRPDRGVRHHGHRRRCRQPAGRGAAHRGGRADRLRVGRRACPDRSAGRCG